MIRQVCSHCGVALDGDRRPPRNCRDISHGICRACMEVFLESSRETLDDLLDEIEVPVFVVDDEGLVRGANLRAQTMIGKKLDHIDGRLGGEVIGCAFADEPEGCGRTVHCRTCTIRNSVEHTHATGRPLVGG